MAFLLKREPSVLCVLVRKNGIDLRLYENYKEGILISNGNTVSMFGGKIFRNYYNESNNFILQKIKITTSSFANGVVMDEIRTKDGRSHTLNPNYKAIQEKSRERFEKKYQALINSKEIREVQQLMYEAWNGARNS
jgi:predicted RNA-binding protein YlxR (DUF448 family)